MNKDIEVLLQAIFITEEKYGKGTTKWIDYLYHGDISCFTSTGGAREMMKSISNRQLLKHVLSSILNQLRYYLEREPFYSDNEVANYIIHWMSQKSVSSFDESYPSLEVVSREFLKEFETFETKFDNHEILKVLIGDFRSVFNSRQRFENSGKLVAIFGKLILMIEGRKEELLAQIKEDVSICNKPLIRKSFLDSDLEKFMQAVEITEQKYGFGKGHVPYFDYLERGDVNAFSSKDGAKDMVSSLDYRVVRFKVVLEMLQNINGDYETVIPYQPPCNSVIVNFVDRVNWEFENSEHVNQIYDEVIDNLFSNGKRNSETLAYALEIIVGNISKDPNVACSSGLEMQRKKTCEYLKQLIYYTEELLEEEKMQKIG